MENDPINQLRECTKQVRERIVEVAKDMKERQETGILGDGAMREIAKTIPAIKTEHRIAVIENIANDIFRDFFLERHSGY